MDNRGGFRGNRNYNRRNDRNDRNDRGDRNDRNDRGDRQKRQWVPRAGEERPKKEAILDLSKYRDQRIRVKFQGGREITGLLKGYDQLMNLVLEEVKETLRDPEDENVLLDKTRDLGTVVVRGPLLLSISPVEGIEVIENPFLQQQE
ncbi:U6 snRNA-associated Sm-like protein LSm7 [Trichomonascus vanleenenianus]|uniref:Sm-like protein LSM7 n=1 Tax=Trichomonascus vanleenenianus TaxID=2268995 RepID=UPI003EC9EEBA